MLTAAAGKLKASAKRHDPDAFYRYDIEFHRTLWACTGNAFLTKALSQITVPLFAFWTLRHLREADVDLVRQAAAHERIAKAGNKRQARKVTKSALLEF